MSTQSEVQSLGIKTLTHNGKDISIIPRKHQFELKTQNGKYQLVIDPVLLNTLTEDQIKSLTNYFLDVYKYKEVRIVSMAVISALLLYLAVSFPLAKLLYFLLTFTVGILVWQIYEVVEKGEEKLKQSKYPFLITLKNLHLVLVSQDRLTASRQNLIDQYSSPELSEEDKKWLEHLIENS